MNVCVYVQSMKSFAKDSTHGFEQKKVSYNLNFCCQRCSNAYEVVKNFKDLFIEHILNKTEILNHFRN